MSEEQKNASNEEEKKDQPANQEVEKTVNSASEIEEEDFSEEKIEHYELLYLVPMSFTAEELEPIKEKVKKIITDQQGDITKEDDLGKQKLAYPIKKQSHGYYLLYEFDLPTENLKDLHNALTLTNQIIRFLIVKKKIKTAEELKQEKALQEKLAKKKEEEIEKIKEAKEEIKEKAPKDDKKAKVSLEDLDKKLDELLDTDDIV